MSNPFDPQRLAITRNPNPQDMAVPVPHHKPGDHFLKGPIAWNWLCMAAHQSGKALQVAIALWFLVGVKKSGQVILSGATLRKLGVGRHSGYRGLRRLELANLVAVQRHPGRNPIVTILAVEEDGEPE
jgi:hypothetical protein